MPLPLRRMNLTFAFTRSSHLPFRHDPSLNLGFSREGATCSWTSCSNLAEFLPLRSVQSLSRRFYDMLPIRRVGSFTFPLRSLIAKFLSIRSEEHTSELQSPMYLVCRLLL